MTIPKVNRFGLKTLRIKLLNTSTIYLYNFICAWFINIFKIFIAIGSYIKNTLLIGWNIDFMSFFALSEFIFYRFVELRTSDWYSWSLIFFISSLLKVNFVNLVLINENCQKNRVCKLREKFFNVLNVFLNITLINCILIWHLMNMIIPNANVEVGQRSIKTRG